MSSIEIYKILNVTDICLEYLTLSNINNFVLVFCSEQNKSFSLIETKTEETSDEFFEITPFNFNMLSISSPQEQYSDILGTNSNQKINEMDISCMNELRDTQNYTFEAKDFSVQEYLTKYLSGDLSEHSFKGLLNYLSEDLQEDCEMFKNNQGDGISCANTDIEKNLDTLPNKHSQHFMADKSMKTFPVLTTLAQETEPLVVSQCDSEKEQNNFEICESLMDIPTTPCSTSYSLNSKAYMTPSVIEENMEVINIEKKHSNIHEQHTINNQSGEDISTKRHIKEVDRFDKRIVKMSNVFNSHTNSNPWVEPSNSNITEILNKKASFPTTCHTKASKLKMTKDIQRLKIFRPVVKRSNFLFPSDPDRLMAHIHYNLNIRIIPKSGNTDSFLEKTFIFEIEKIFLCRNGIEELWHEITYTISFIPKFFKSEFNKSKEILYSHEQYIPKTHDFYYTIRRTIEIQVYEKLQRINVVPVLKFDEECFWRKKYVEVIKQWQYKLLNSNQVRKKTTTKLNKKGKYESKRIRDFLNKIFNIREYKEIHNPIVCTIFDKLKSFYSHIQFISVHRVSSLSLEKGCVSIWKCRNKFYDTGKLEPPSEGLNPIEIEVAVVYHKIYYNFMNLSNTILDCYNEFGREDNEDLLTYE